MILSNSVVFFFLFDPKKKPKQNIEKKFIDKNSNIKSKREKKILLLAYKLREFIDWCSVLAWVSNNEQKQK